MPGPVPGLRGAAHHQGRAAGHPGTAEGAVPGTGGAGCAGHRLVAERVEQRPAAGERGREPQEDHQVLPDRVAALLRGRQVRAGAREVQQLVAAEVPAAGLAVRAVPEPQPPATVRGHIAPDVRHQGAGMPHVHMQTRDGRQRVGPVLFPRVRRLVVRQTVGRRRRRRQRHQRRRHGRQQHIRHGAHQQVDGQQHHRESGGMAAHDQRRCRGRKHHDPEQRSFQRYHHAGGLGQLDGRSVRVQRRREPQGVGGQHQGHIREGRPVRRREYDAQLAVQQAASAGRRCTTSAASATATTARQRRQVQEEQGETAPQANANRWKSRGPVRAVLKRVVDETHERRRWWPKLGVLERHPSEPGTAKGVLATAAAPAAQPHLLERRRHHAQTYERVSPASAPSSPRHDATTAAAAHHDGADHVATSQENAQDETGHDAGAETRHDSGQFHADADVHTHGQEIQTRHAGAHADGDGRADLHAVRPAAQSCRVVSAGAFPSRSIPDAAVRQQQQQHRASGQEQKRKKG